MNREHTVRGKPGSTLDGDADGDKASASKDEDPKDPPINKPNVKRLQWVNPRTAVFHTSQASGRRGRTDDDAHVMHTPLQDAQRNRLEQVLGLTAPKPLRSWIQTQHLFNDRGICVLCHIDEKDLCTCAGT